jgi:hypothetical protein
VRRSSGTLIRVAIAWTLIFAAALTTALTTGGGHADRDGEAPWLAWMLPVAWLVGVALLVLVGHKRRRGS